MTGEPDGGGGWDDGAESFDVEALKGRRCYGGLDLATTTDIAAYVLVFPPVEPNEKWKVACRFFVPKMNLAVRVKRDHVPYDEWEKVGLLTATEGNVIDYAFIIAAVKSDAELYELVEVAIDRWNSTHVATLLQDEGITPVLFGQGFASMAGPAREFETLVVGRQIQHGGHPILRWMAANAAVKQDPAGNIKPDKAKSTERIDGIVASVMALGRAMGTPDEGSIDGWLRSPVSA
jgi:phage terminase large subunit-like protein